MRPKRFSFGGCVYRMAVDARHAAALAALAAHSQRMLDKLPELAAIDYMHTSNLPQGRCLWLRRQLADKARLDYAISCDGDTTFDPAALLAELAVVEGQIAIGIAPVRIGGTEDLCNVNLTDDDERINARVDGAAPPVGRRAFGRELAGVLAGDRLIASGGFGLVVFNLRWFHAAWPEPAPERVSIDTGEDIELCRSVRARGGLVAALNVRTDHFAYGEKQVR